MVPPRCINARNSQLTATNERLEQLSNSKDTQITDLRSKNDDPATSINDLVTLSLGKRIRTRRGEISLTQSDSGSLSNTDRTYISGVERGRRNPTFCYLGAWL